MKSKGMRVLVQRTVAIGIVLALGVVTSLSLLNGVTNAASGTMSVSSATATHGTNVTLTVSLNTSTAVDSVSAIVKYDTSKLTYVSTDVSGSSFDTTLPGSAGSGTVDLERTTLSNTNGMTGNLLIARITFTALPYSGSTSVSLDPSSMAAHAGTNTSPALSAGSVTFSPGACPAGQTGTPPNCTTPTPPPSSGGSSGGGTKSGSGGTTKTGGSTTGTSTGTKTGTSGSSTGTKTTTPPAPGALTAPTITGTNFQYTTATVTATTNVTAQVYVKYGLAADALNTQTPLTAASTSHTITLNNLPIATTVYYQLIAQDGKTTTTSAVQNTRTKGLSVNLLLQDKNHKPVANQSVTIQPEGITGKSSKDGRVTLNDLAPGSHQVELKSGSKTYSAPFTLLSNIVASGDNQTSAPQNATASYKNYTYSSVVVWPFVLGGILLVALIVALVIMNKRKNDPFNRPLAPLPEGSIVSGSAASSVTPPASPSGYNPFSSNDDTTPPTPPQEGQ